LLFYRLLLLQIKNKRGKIEYNRIIGCGSMFEKFGIYFLMFLLYSFFGWVLEVLVMVYHTKKVINRGFLIGPICPIYGYAAILMTLFIQRYQENPALVFLMAVFIASILEYGTSYIMEKLFHARWWDYSHQKFNLNGRICLSTMIPFGLLGLFIIYLSNPFFFRLLEKTPPFFITIFFWFSLIIYIIDTIVSFTIIFKFRNVTKQARKDHTEEITAYVKEILLHRSILSRRLIHAFPKLKARIEERKRKA